MKQRIILAWLTQTNAHSFLLKTFRYYELDTQLSKLGNFSNKKYLNFENV